MPAKDSKPRAAPEPGRRRRSGLVKRAPPARPPSATVDPGRVAVSDAILETSSLGIAIVNRAGYASPVRTPRGEDIMAACGQLKSASERARRVGRA